MKGENRILLLLATLFFFGILIPHAKAQSFNLSKVADLNTPIPGGSGNFADFNNPVISGSNVAFRGEGTAGQRGFYLFNGATLSKVADLNTPIPDGTGNFIDFDSLGSPVTSGGNVAFLGKGSAVQTGVYLFNGTGLSKVADRNTSIPGGSGNFIDFLDPVISDGNVAFAGFGIGQEGVYLSHGTTLRIVADVNTPIPGGVGNFTSFSSPVISDSNVAFDGGGESSQEGIYLFSGSTLTKVVDRNTPIPGGSGNFTFFSGIIISDGNIAFFGRGGGGQLGIYLFNGAVLSKVVDLNTPIPDGVGDFTDLGSPPDDPMISDHRVVIRGLAPFQVGIYLFDGTTLRKVANNNTPIPGGTGNFVNFKFPMISNSQVAFEGSGMGQAGIYILKGATISKVVDSNTAIPAGSGNFSFFNFPAISGANIAFQGMGDAQEGIYLASFQSQTVSVPAMSEWGLIIMSLLLGISAIKLMRNKRSV